MSVINSLTPVRRRGRPRAFDRDAALAAAAEMFWRRGYEGASIADLTAAMGITPQSLYSAFTSKADLYREALTWFQTHVGFFTRPALELEPSVFDAFGRLFRASARAFTAHADLRGCMISTALLGCAVENEAVARHVAALRKDAQALLQARIERAIRDGELRADTYAAGLARYFATIIQGMSVQARDGATEADLLIVAELAMAALHRHRA